MILAAALAGERGTYLLHNSVMVVNNNNDAFVSVFYYYQNAFTNDPGNTTVR